MENIFPSVAKNQENIFCQIKHYYTKNEHFIQ